MDSEGSSSVIKVRTEGLKVDLVLVDDKVSGLTIDYQNVKESAELEKWINVVDEMICPSSSSLADSTLPAPVPEPEPQMPSPPEENDLENPIEAPEMVQAETSAPDQSSKVDLEALARRMGVKPESLEKWIDEMEGTGDEIIPDASPEPSPEAASEAIESPPADVFTDIEEPEEQGAVVAIQAQPVKQSGPDLENMSSRLGVRLSNLEEWIRQIEGRVNVDKTQETHLELLRDIEESTKNRLSIAKETASTTPTAKVEVTVRVEPPMQPAPVIAIQQADPLPAPQPQAPAATASLPALSAAPALPAPTVLSQQPQGVAAEAQPDVGDYRKIVLQAVDKGLDMVGKYGKQTLLGLLESRYGLREEEIPDHARAFVGLLEADLGTSALTVEKEIMRDIRKQSGVEGVNLYTVVESLKRKFPAKEPDESKQARNTPVARAASPSPPVSLEKEKKESRPESMQESKQDIKKTEVPIPAGFSYSMKDPIPTGFKYNGYFSKEASKEKNKKK